MTQFALLIYTLAWGTPCNAHTRNKMTVQTRRDIVCLFVCLFVCLLHSTLFMYRMYWSGDECPAQHNVTVRTVRKLCSVSFPIEEIKDL